MRTPEEILNTLSAERQKLMDDVLKQIEDAQELLFKGCAIQVALSLNKSEYEGIKVKLAASLKSKRWQILKASTFESQGDAVTTLTIDRISPPSDSVLFSRTYG